MRLIQLFYQVGLFGGNFVFVVCIITSCNSGHN